MAVSLPAWIDSFLHQVGTRFPPTHTPPNAVGYLPPARNMQCGAAPTSNASRVVLGLGPVPLSVPGASVGLSERSEEIPLLIL